MGDFAQDITGDSGDCDVDLLGECDLDLVFLNCVDSVESSSL